MLLLADSEDEVAAASAADQHLVGVLSAPSDSGCGAASAGCCCRRCCRRCRRFFTSSRLRSHELELKKYRDQRPSSRPLRGDGGSRRAAKCQPVGGDPARGPGAEDARAFRSPPGWYAACWFRVCTRDFVPAALCLAARVAPGRTHTHTPGAANARVKGEHPLVRALSAIRHRWYVLRGARCSVCTQVCMRQRVNACACCLFACVCLPASPPT